MRALAFTVCLAAAAVGSTALAKPKKGASKKAGDKKADEKAPPAAPAVNREILDQAILLIKKEQYGDAAVSLERIAATEKNHEDEALYNLGKALYRMKLYHSALTFFERILEKGPANRYYQSALEWCLFISRKTSDQERVNEIIAKNAATDFPADYRDEFHFRLARFHFQRAIAIESGAIAGTLGETRIEDSVTGGKSFKGDIFSGEGGEEEGGGGEEGEGKVEEKEGGGLSIGEDLFSDDPAPPKLEKKEEPKKEEPRKEAPKTGGGDIFALSAKEHVEAAGRMIMRVDTKSKWGARAKFLEALVLYKQGKPNDALEAFKSVVRETKGLDTIRASDLREQAFFQLARAHFGAQQPSFSIFYYNKVDRDSYAWLDALYEASWAEFRLGNYEKALGNLLTLHSPFFLEEYYPESLILKAVVYYENCRYVEAKDILTAFLKRYEPVLEELKRLTTRDQPAEQYYEILANIRTGELAESEKAKTDILAQILTLALKDEELRRLDQSYREVDGELRSFASQSGGFAGSELATRLDDGLSTVRLRLSQEAGKAVKRRLEQEREAIRLLIEQAIRIDIETSRAEQERIESKLREVQSNPAYRENEFIEWTDDEKLVWPFQGEYWRDELGTYELTLANTCKRSS
jgi:tetratricopeptide (TPR) repeat protein